MKIFVFGLLLIPAFAQANCFIDIGSGESSGSVTIQTIKNGTQTFSEHDKSGATKSLIAGCSVTNKVSVSFDYTELSETFELLGTELGIETRNYGISASLDLFQSSKFNVAMGAGYGKWDSKTVTHEAHWDYSYTPVRLIIEDKTNSADGYTPYAYANFIYRLNSRFSIGLKYSYYQELGYMEPIIDLDALSVGDIPAALKSGDFKNSGVEIYTLHFRWSF